MWPILGAQLAAVVSARPLLLRRRGADRRPSGVPLRWLLVAGMLDMTANALYIIAVQRGDLSIIAPVAVAVSGEHGPAGDARRPRAAAPGAARRARPRRDRPGARRIVTGR